MAKRKPAQDSNIAVADADQIENPPDYDKLVNAHDEVERDLNDAPVLQTPARKRDQQIDRRAARIAGMQGAPPADGPAAIDIDLPPGASPAATSNATTAQPPAVAPTPPLAAPTLSERLIVMAESWGIPREDAEAFPNDAALTRAIDALKRRYGAPGGQQGMSQQPASPPPTLQAAALPPAPAPQQAAQPNAAPQNGFQPYSFTLPPTLLDPTAYNEDTVAFAKAVQGMHQHYAQAMQRLAEENRQTKAAFDKILSSAQTYQGVNEISQFDTFIDALGKDFHDHYGDGATEDLPAESPQFKNRDEVFRVFEEMRSNYVMRGERPPSSRKLMKLAHQAVNADLIKQKAVSNISERARTASGQFINRTASNRTNGHALDPEQEAIARFAARRRALGLGPQGRAEQFE